jgi:hypothetical protein
MVPQIMARRASWQAGPSDSGSEDSRTVVLLAPQVAVSRGEQRAIHGWWKLGNVRRESLSHHTWQRQGPS